MKNKTVIFADDGNVDCVVLSEAELNKRLAEGYYGEEGEDFTILRGQTALLQEMKSSQMTTLSLNEQENLLIILD